MKHLKVLVRFNWWWNVTCVWTISLKFEIYFLEFPWEIVFGVTSAGQLFASLAFRKRNKNCICMGYWPSVRSRWLDIGQVLFCAFMDQDGVEVHKLAKEERGQYPAILTEQAWSIKDLLYGFQGNFSCRTRRVVPSGQDSSILPARVANHSAGFDSSCPLAELAI